MSMTQQPEMTTSGAPMGQANSQAAPLPERAFDVVVLSEYWGLLSLFLFLAAVSSRQLVGLLPYRLQGYHLMPPLAVLIVPVVSGIGFLFALFGRRYGGTARIGMIANGCVLLLSLLLVGLAWSFRNPG